MMWSHSGFGVGWILLPILCMVMMIAMMFLMPRMMGHHHDDEIRSLRKELAELKKNQGIK